LTGYYKINMFLKVLFAFLWSGVKYLIGVASCMAMFSNPGIGFLITSAGALSGVLVFTFGGWWVEQIFKKKFMSHGKHFNKRTRMLIRLKRNGGLPLVAILTPVILSIPIGCIMATTFVHNRWKIVLYMAFSVLIWGVFIFGSQWIFGIDLAKAIRSL